MAHLNILVTWHLRMDGCHALGRPVIVNNQIMGPYDPLILFHKLFDLPVHFRINSFPDQRRQSIFGNIHPGYHNGNRHCQPYDPVNIYPP